MAIMASPDRRVHKRFRNMPPSLGGNGFSLSHVINIFYFLASREGNSSVKITDALGPGELQKKVTIS